MSGAEVMMMVGVAAATYIAGMTVLIAAWKFFRR